MVSLEGGDHVLLYTDGAWDTLADDDGRAEERLQAAIAHAPEGGAALLDAILADVYRQLHGRPQPDDITLMTATVLPPKRTSD